MTCDDSLLTQSHCFFPLFRRFFFQISHQSFRKPSIFFRLFPLFSHIFPHVSQLLCGFWRFLSLEIPCPVLFNGVLHYSAKHALLAAQFPDATDLLQVRFFGFEGFRCEIIFGQFNVKWPWVIFPIEIGEMIGKCKLWNIAIFHFYGDFHMRFHGHLMGLNGCFMGFHGISWGNVIFHGILGYEAPTTMVNYIHLQKIELHFQVGIYKSKDKEC